MFKQQQEREYHVDLFQLFLCKNPNRAGGAAWPLPRAKVMPKNTQPQSAQKVNMHINLTCPTLQKHFNEIPELHSKATIPPVVK